MDFPTMQMFNIKREISELKSVVDNLTIKIDSISSIKNFSSSLSGVSLSSFNVYLVDFTE